MSEAGSTQLRERDPVDTLRRAADLLEKEVAAHPGDVQWALLMAQVYLIRNAVERIEARFDLLLRNKQAYMDAYMKLRAVTGIDLGGPKP